jgi:hypothetical protein
VRFESGNIMSNTDAPIGELNWYWCGSKFQCPTYNNNDYEEDASPRRKLCFIHVYEKYNNLVEEHIKSAENERNAEVQNRDKYLQFSEGRRQVLTVMSRGLLTWLKNKMDSIAPSYSTTTKVYRRKRNKKVSSR